MTKSGLLKCLLSIALIAYLAVALSFTSRMAAEDTFTGVKINVADSTLRRFVTADDIDSELGGLRARIRHMRHDSLNTLTLEKVIMSKDNIESVNCVVLNDGSLRIDVVPLIPVARVFDNDGDNYYVNRVGKRMRASVQYRTDVPIVTGSFHHGASPTDVLPLLDYLSAHPDMAALTSAVSISHNGDIILVPTIKGHVVNIGDTNDLQNKFDRLSTFYHKVMPAKGWEYYDTITVKWRGQIVAKRRKGAPSPPPVLEEEHLDLDDEGTMLTSSATNE